MTEIHKDIIIIGGGPAGLTAALYCRRAGFEVLVFEGEIPGGKLNFTPEIENYPGASVTEGAALAAAMQSQAEAAGAEIVYKCVTHTNLSGNAKTVAADEDIYTCTALIIASGSKNRKLNVPGEAEFFGRGVSYCAICDGSFFKKLDVAVCGGGDTALEEVQYLAGLCNKVYLVHRRDTFRGSDTNIRRVKALHNVEFVLNSVVTEISGEKRVESVTLQNAGSLVKLPVSGLFIAIGSTPVTSFIPDGAIELAPDGSIITDSLMQTSAPGVFAAGDVRSTPLRQIVIAASDGAVAAASAGKYIADCKSCDEPAKS